MSASAAVTCGGGGRQAESSTRLSSQLPILPVFAGSMITKRPNGTGGLASTSANTKIGFCALKLAAKFCENPLPA